MQNPKSRQKSPSGHHRTTLSGCIFATKARIDNRKNLLSSNISSTCPHNMVDFGPLAAEIVLLVWGTPGNFNGFRVLAALLHSTLVVGVSQTLRRWTWTKGATYIQQGGHHVGHWPTFLVSHCSRRCTYTVCRMIICYYPVPSGCLQLSSPSLSQSQRSLVFWTAVYKAICFNVFTQPQSALYETIYLPDKSNLPVYLSHVLWTSRTTYVTAIARALVSAGLCNGVCRVSVGLTQPHSKLWTSPKDHAP